MAEAAKSLKVFVSYSRTDVEFADQLVLALQDKGFDPILDRHDMSGGENWRERLGKLILSADAVTFILTAKSAASEICAWEVEEAARLSKRILPVVYGSVTGVTPPKALSDLNWIPFWADPAIPGSGFYYGVIRLIEALSVDLDWLRAQTRYSERASEWAKSARAEDMLLRGEALKEAHTWLGRTPAGSSPPDSVREYLAASSDAEQRREAAAKAQLEEREQAVKMAEAAVAEKQAAVAEKAKADRRLRVLALSALGAGLILVASALWGLWYAGAKSAEAGERRAELFAQTSVQLLRDGEQPMAMLMAIAGDPGAHEGLFPGFFRPEGYSSLKAALARAYSSDRLVYSTATDSQLTAMVALSGGNRFVTFHADRRARIWEAGADKPVRTLDLPEIVGEAYVVPDAPEGDHAAAKGDRLLLRWGTNFETSDRAPSLWSLESDSEIQSFTANVPATAINASATGGHAVIGYEDGKVASWTFGKPKPDHWFDIADGSAITAVVMSADADYFSAGNRHGVVTTGEIETGEMSSKTADSEGILSLAYAPQADVVVSGTATGLFGVLPTGHTDEYIAMPGFAAKLGDDAIGVARLIISPDERLILLLSTEGEAKLLRLGNGASMEQLNGRRDIANAVFLPTANALATASPEGVVKVWALARPDGATTDTDISYSTSLTRINTMYVVQHTNEISVRRFASVEPLFAGKYKSVYASAISDDGQILVTSTDEGLCIRRIAESQPCTPVATPDEAHRVTRIVFDPTGRKFLTLRYGEAAPEIWDVDGTAPIATLGDVKLSSSVVVGPDAQYLLDRSYDGVILIRVSDGVAQPLADGKDVTAVAFSPDGARFAVGLGQGGVQLWRVGEDKPTQVFKGHSKAVRTIAFDKSGGMFLTGGEDGAARLWRLDEQESLEHFETIEKDVYAVAFDADGKNVLLMDGKSISRWAISPAVMGKADEQIGLACARLDELGLAGFSPEDRLRYPILKGVPDNPCVKLGLTKAKPKPVSAPKPVAATAATPTSGRAPGP